MLKAHTHTHTHTHTRVQEDRQSGLNQTGRGVCITMIYYVLQSISDCTPQVSCYHVLQYTMMDLELSC